MLAGAKKLFDLSLVLPACLVALAMALAFPPAGFWPLGWLAMVGWAMVFGRSEHLRKNPGRFFFWYAVMVHLLGFYWIAYLFREFGGMPWAVATILLFGALVVMSVGSALWGFIFGWLCRRGSKRISMFCWLGVVWVLWDTFDFRFFPWTPIMSVAGSETLLASAGILGNPGWRVLFFGSAALVGWLLSTPRLVRRDRILLTITAVVVTWSVPVLLGIKNRRDLMASHPNSQPIAILQGNIGNSFKKNAKLGEVPSIYKIASIYRDLVDEAAIHFYSETELPAGTMPFYFWPETSFPSDWNRDDFLARDLRNWVDRSKGLHIIGAYESGTISFGDINKNVDFNVLAQLGAGRAPGAYRKHIRIPFGEYIPGDKWFPQAYSWLKVVNHFGAGEDLKLLNTEGPGPVLVPLICYEILFESFVNDFVAKARREYPDRDIVLVNPSNDSWYGPTSQPFQNEYLARWNSARLGVGLVRPANTGISTIIAPWGEVLSKGHLDEPEVIYGEMPVR